MTTTTAASTSPKTLFAVWYPSVDDIWFAGRDREAVWAEAVEWVRNESGWNDTGMDAFESGDVDPRYDGLYINGECVYTCPTICYAQEKLAE